MTSEPRRRDPVLRWGIGDAPGDITVSWLFATMPVTLTWGDGTPREVLGVGHTLPHHYDTLGGCKVRARQTGGAQPVLAEAQIVIRDHKPQLTLALNPDDPSVIVATAPSTLDTTKIIPEYRVHWNYQTDPYDWTDFWGMPNASVRHSMPPGTYTARIYDLGTKWWVETGYTIPEPTLDCTVTATGRVATLTVTKATPGKDLLVAWGDKTVTEKLTGTTGTHTYPSTVDDTYLVQLVYADNSETAIKTVAIPGGSE